MISPAIRPKALPTECGKMYQNDWRRVDMFRQDKAKDGHQHRSIK